MISNKILLFIGIVAMGQIQLAFGQYNNIKGAGSGKCVGILNGALGDGANAVLWDCKATATDQMFTFTPAAWSSNPNAILLKPKHSEKCLGVYASSSTNGAKVVQWTCKQSTDQLWEQTLDVNGNTQFLNVGSNKLLSVYFGSSLNGAQLTIWEANGGADQKWIPTAVA